MQDGEKPAARWDAGWGRETEGTAQRLLMLFDVYRNTSVTMWSAGVETSEHDRGSSMSAYSSYTQGDGIIYQPKDQYRTL